MDNLIEIIKHFSKTTKILERKFAVVIKVALIGVCFALKSWKEYLHLFIYLITLGKDVNFH